MANEDPTKRLILVVEDIQETRDGIEKLLQADGYQIALARDEQDAIEIASRLAPELILVSLAGLPHEVILTARRIRERAALGEHVAVVVFCIEGLAQGAEEALGQHVYVTRPDNFNQLRRLIARLLHKNPTSTRIELLTV